MNLQAKTALYGVATLLDRLLAFAALPVLTRLMGPADFGAWTQAGAASGVLGALLLFGMPTAVVRSFPLGTGRLRPSFDRLGGVLLGLALVAGLAFECAGGPVAGWIWGDPAAAGLLPALLLWAVAEAAIEFCLAWHRTQGRMARLSTVMLLRSAWRYAWLGWLLWPRDGALAHWLPAFAAGQLALAVAVWVDTRRHLPTDAADPPRLPPPLTEVLRFCVPLFLLAAFTAVNGVLDRFLLLRSLDLAGLGVYAAAQSLSNTLTLFYTVLGYTLFPVLSSQWQAGAREEAGALVERVLRVYLFCAVPAVVLLSLVGPWALPRLTTAHYDAPPLLFAAQAAAVLLFGVYQILLYPLLLAGRSAQVLGFAGVAVACNAALNLLLTPHWGAPGAAMAQCGAQVLMAVLAARQAHRLLPWRFPWRAGVAPLARALAAALPLGAAVRWAPERPVVVLAALAVAGWLCVGPALWRQARRLRRANP